MSGLGASVLFVHPEWQVGGVERTNEQWIKILNQAGIHTQIASCQSTQPISLNNSISIKYYYLNKIRLYLSLPFIARSYTNIIICQTYFLPWILVQLFILKFIFRCRIILAERNSFSQYKDNRIKRQVLEIIFYKFSFLFDSITFNSYELKNESAFVKLLPKSHVIVNPRFSEKEAYSVKRKPNILDPDTISVFARWAPQKNPDFMIEAHKLFNSMNKSYNVYCDSSNLDFQRQFVENAFEFMHLNPTVIMFCSYFEGYPNILLEARVLGLPILYSKCPTGVDEIMSGYSNGYEFDFNSIKSLKSAYDCFRANPSRIQVDYQKLYEHHIDNVAMQDKLLRALIC